MDQLEESILIVLAFRVWHFHACQLVSLSALTPPSHAKPPDAKDKSKANNPRGGCQHGKKHTFSYSIEEWLHHSDPGS
jgi:hypothetical protein